MAEQMMQPQARTEMEQTAAQAVSALKDCIYSGNQQKKSEFVSIYEANGANPEFANALAAEFSAKIASDRKFGPVVNAYRDACEGKFHALRFVTFVESVRSAVASGDQDLLRRLRDPAQSSAEFVRDAVEPLLAMFTAAATPVRKEDMKEAALTAGGLFIGLVETARMEEGSRPAMRDLSARRSEMKRISSDILREMGTHAKEGAFEPGFVGSFMGVLGEQCPQCIGIINAFARDRGVQKPEELGYRKFAELLDILPRLFNGLMTPGYDMDKVSLTYGRNLAAAARAYIIQMSTPQLEGISVQTLTKRVGEVEQFIADKKVQGLDTLISDWKKRLSASPSRDELLALNAQIPSVAMLDEIEILMARSGRQIKAVLAGTDDFYMTMGTHVWVPRLETMAKALRDAINDQYMGKFAAAMLLKERINLENVENLITAANNANKAIPQAITTLDELLRTTPLDRQQARLDAINTVFAKGGIVDGAIEKLTDAVAAFYASPDRKALREAVERRLMIQFVVPVAGQAPVETLRTRYADMAVNREFLAFRTGFTAEIDRHIAALGAATPTLSGDAVLNQSRREMAIRAREAFNSMRLEYAYGIYRTMGEAFGGANWERAVRGNTGAMAKVCALVAEFYSLPAPYASYALSAIGSNLVRNYDDASIGIIAGYVAGSSQIFLGGDYQHLLIQYYLSLPGKMKEGLFPDITTMQKERREAEYDVRIRTPPEDPAFAEIFVPAISIRVRVPKRVYEEWQGSGVLQVAKSASIVNTAAWPPDFVRTMQEFIDEPMLEGKVNLPLPFIRVPALLQGIQNLAPDFFPPVGEYISAMASADYTYHHNYTVDQAGTKTADASTTTINAAQEFVKEGATTTWRESYEVSEGLGQDKRQTGKIEVQNLRKQNFNVNTASVDFEQVGSTLQTIGATFSGIAPRGAETAILFRRNETNLKEVEFTAHVYQRGPNGSFILADAITLDEGEAQAIYEQAVERPLERLYGEARVQPKGGGVRAQLDGAVLFSGPFTSEYTAWDDFQGAGAALQVKQFGGYVDYERTRRGRAAGAFGRFVPEDQSFWIGRLTAENLTVEEDGKRKFYGELAYMKADTRELKAFVGLAKNMKADDLQGAAIYNAMFNRSVLGMRYGGIGAGRLIRETGTGTETLGGGRIYGVGEDVMNGIVASGLYRTFRETQQAPLTLTSDARSFYSQNTGLEVAMRQAGATEAARQRLYGLLTSTDPADRQTLADAGITVDAGNNVTLGAGSAAWLRTYAQANAGATAAKRENATQALVSAGVREMIARNLMLETGAGWDMLNDEGAGMLNFDWIPRSYGVSDIGLHAYAIGKDRHITPIIGGIGEFMPALGIRTTTEGYYPGIGELRLRTPWIDFSLGGGRLEQTAQGIHAGLRIPLGRRWTLGAGTSFSNDQLMNEAKRLTQEEGIAGAIFTMPYSATPGFRLANIFTSLAFIHQNEEVAAKNTAEAYQWDANAGLNWMTARSTLTLRFGVQQWEAVRESTERTKQSLTGGLAYTARTWKPGKYLLFINPSLTADVAAGVESDKDVASGSKTTTTDWRVNIKATTGF